MKESKAKREKKKVKDIKYQMKMAYDLLQEYKRTPADKNKSNFDLVRGFIQQYELDFLSSLSRKQLLKYYNQSIQENAGKKFHIVDLEGIFDMTNKDRSDHFRTLKAQNEAK